MVRKKENTIIINMVGQQGAKRSLLNIGLCENISIFLEKARIQWQNCNANIHSERFYH